MIEHLRAAAHKEVIKAGKTKRRDYTFVHRANVEFHDGDTVDAHVKLFGQAADGPVNRELANEVVCYLLARALGLPVPARAAVMALDRARIMGAQQGLQLADGITALPAFITESVAHDALQADRPNPEWLKELFTWEGFAEACTFDDWAANVDRNYGNVLRTADGQFCLIDHGHAFTGPAWLPDMLAQSADDEQRNKMLDWVGIHAQALMPANWIKSTLGSGMVGAAAMAPAALAQTRQAVQDWVPSVTDDASIAPAMLDFLAQRATSMAERLRKRARLLL